MPLVVAGRVRGLKGHRWLIAACETKILMTDLVSRATREVPRAVLDGRAPTSLAFLYKCSPILLGAAAASPRLFSCALVPLQRCRCKSCCDISVRTVKDT